MFGKLIRLITFNYLTLGWWFPPLVPKWVKARRKMDKPEHWERIVILKYASLNKQSKQQALKEARNLVQRCIPWYSTKETNLALKYLARKRKVYLPCLMEDLERIENIDKEHIKYSSQRWECCGGEWQYGDCACVRPDLADLQFPFKPLLSVRVNEEV